MPHTETIDSTPPASSKDAPVTQPPAPPTPEWPQATRDAALRLGGYSFLILFIELALIRYIPAYVRVVGFYLNFVLMATFLGMGIGLLRAHNADVLRWIAPPVLLALALGVKHFSNVFVVAPLDANDYLWSGAFGLSPNITRIGVLPVTVLMFALATAVFIPLGALLGRELRKFPPLTAYSIDIGGSLLGILAFAVASLLRTPPITWFVVGFALWTILSLDHRRFAVAFGLTAAAVVGIATWTSQPKPEYWSPYYRVNAIPLGNGVAVNVNGSFHQHVVDLDPSGNALDTLARAIRQDYLRPYGLAGRPDTALVVGAGTGNDVAILLQVGAAYVDAVEIDPVILDLGRAAHPQQPYADARVHPHVDDARAFLRKTDQTYDVIAMGTLDSHTQLAGMSSLRLDNYVYTLEAFQAARARLKPGGTLIAYHLSQQPYIAAKLYAMLTEAFGTEPIVLYDEDPTFFNFTFLAGGAADRATEKGGLPSLAQRELASVAVPTDDWPYLYLRQRTVPTHYLQALVAVLLLAVIGVGGAAGRAMGKGADGLMFFMGAGFLLVETKSVTEMSLLFGSTWVVNVLVFASILTVILLANFHVQRRPPTSVTPLFVALFVSLLAAYVVPVRSLLLFGLAGRWILGAVMVSLPIFFAAIIFATLFRTRQDASRALGYNLLGAVAGGVLEYSSMLVGIKGLYLVAFGVYLLAYLASRRPAPASAPAMELAPALGD